MSAETKIEWADRTWNPLLGCERVSPGCEGCYAINTATIRAGNPHPAVAAAFAGLTERREGRLDWTGRINLLPNRLHQPLSWRKAQKVFVNSQSDLFHKDVPDDYIAQVFAVMAMAPQHTFQVLTKRHGRMRSLLNSDRFWRLVGDAGKGIALDRVAGRYPTAGPLALTADSSAHGHWEAAQPLPNVWLGVSVEDQKWADLRIPALLDTPAAVRWLSIEPLLGPVDIGLGDPHRDHESDDINGYPHARVCLTCSDLDNDIQVEYFRRSRDDHYAIDWVVVGGESGPRARPIHADWARSLRDECQYAGVPFFFKQWGGRTPKANGRELDGRTWDEYPHATGSVTR